MYRNKFLVLCINNKETFKIWKEITYILFTKIRYARVTYFWWWSYNFIKENLFFPLHTIWSRMYFCKQSIICIFSNIISTLFRHYSKSGSILHLYPNILGTFACVTAGLRVDGFLRYAVYQTWIYRHLITEMTATRITSNNGWRLEINISQHNPHKPSSPKLTRSLYYGY